MKTETAAVLLVDSTQDATDRLLLSVNLHDGTREPFKLLIG